MSVSTRTADHLSSETYDLLIIGGGIVGAGTARDASMRGLRVALIDQGDFGGGTSSRSSKLIHGGLRYLEQAEIRLVYEACRERRILMKMAPHLVRPLPLLFPCYQSVGRPIWKVRLGLILYDLLAGSTGMPRHQMLARGHVLELEPSLGAERLEGGGLYYDCQTDDARLCLENVFDAASSGAHVCNYVRLEAFLKTGGRITGAVAQDLESGKEITIHARQVVNAAGPWVDEIRFKAEPGATKAVRRTKGIHVLTRRLNREHGIAFTAARDGRLLFVLPFDTTHSLIGTTDTDNPEEDLTRPAVESSDVEYLLREVNDLMPGASLTPNDITGCFAGLRTLIRSTGPASRASREYRIEELPCGLISVIGGKYTTYRVMAARVVDRVVRRLGKPRLACPTHQPLSSSPVIPPEEYAGQIGPMFPGLSNELPQTLMRRYGTRIADVLGAGDPVLHEELSPGCGVLWGEAVHSIRREFARRPIDFLRRRTPYCLLHPPDASISAHLGRLFQSELGWSESVRANHEQETMAEWRGHHPAEAR